MFLLFFRSQFILESSFSLREQFFNFIDPFLSLLLRLDQCCLQLLYRIRGGRKRSEIWVLEVVI